MQQEGVSTPMDWLADAARPWIGRTLEQLGLEELCMIGGESALVPDGVTTLPVEDLPEGARVGVVLVAVIPEDEADLSEAFRKAHAALAPGGQLVVVAVNQRHFLDLALASVTGDLGSTTRPGVPLATYRDLAVEAGFGDPEARPLRLGYGAVEDAGPTGHQLDSASESVVARALSLAHAVLFVAPRLDATPEPYDSDVLAELWESGRLEEAAAYMNGHLARNPGRARVWSDAATILADAGMVRDALACVRRAVSCDPFHEAAVANLHDLLALAEPDDKDGGSCLLELQAAAAISNADTLVELGQTQDALTWAELAFIRSPGTESSDALIRILRRAGAKARVGDVLKAVGRLVATRDGADAPA